MKKEGKKNKTIMLKMMKEYNLLIQIYIFFNTRKMKQGKVKDYRSIYMLSLSVVMGSLTMGYFLVCTTMLSKQLASANDLDLEPDRMTLILSYATSALPIGALLGALAYDKIVNMLGQALLMRIFDIIVMGICMIQAMSLQYHLMIVLRFIIGLLLGVGATAVPTYLISIAPTEISGKIGSLNQIMITVGIATAYAMGFILQNGEDCWRWRVFVSLPIIFCVIRYCSLTFFFPFDTLQRHISRGEFHKLQQFINMFYHQNTLSVDALITSRVTTDTTSSSLQSSTSSLSARTILSYVLCVINQFSGINAILFYANQLFGQLEGVSAQLMTFYLGLFQVLVTMLSGTVMDWFGRRTLMMIGGYTIVGALIGGWGIMYLGWASLWVVGVVFIHVGGFSLSLGPITILYISEILPNINPFMIVIWLQTIVVSLASNILIMNLGIGNSFLIYALITLIGMVYCSFFMRETKGKTRMEILAMFENTKYQAIQSQNFNS